MNKLYIQIFFFLLNIFLYVNNETFATEIVPEEDTAPEPKNRYPSSEEIYEKNKHLLCTNPKESSEVGEVMNEAVKHLEYYATSNDGYELCQNQYSSHKVLFKTKHGQTKIKRFHYEVYGSDEYNEVINKLWDPDHAKSPNASFVKRKIARVYSPNLVMIQQRYKTNPLGRKKYFYALAAKVKISEDTTIIVMASGNINDHNPSSKEYKNTIVESANLFKTDIDSEDDIRKGKLKKTFVNLAGYFIKKGRWRVDITCVESIN
ncbi:fam-a protein [Plasmodium vinckei vinckei]|uniref:Fam-a protein n=1 Tax=Plasmodium vinckei vinckei TaxID=54757 RepID=A0A449BUY1_PLAVN|nr:fam-a protein [Plasmodium vinckei vinckei]VEV57139.1 fam-a protein [Plasmodium vinckei vinckei]